MSKRLLMLLIICVFVGPLVCIQFLPRSGDLEFYPANYSGRKITTELYGWPFMSHSAWKNELSTPGKVTYTFANYHSLNIVLNLVVVVFIGGLVCLFLFQIQQRRDRKICLFDLFAFTFAIACCLAVYQFGPQMFDWTVDTFALADKSKQVVGTQPTSLMLYAYLMVGAFAIFEIFGRFMNRPRIPATPIGND